ncbi:hypothetical protein M407DRAFT_96463 [Tulasnella calospora MUT 4182]|uniref:Uncharacterized protein n=1 Tax=Tulasnella calospora MUT 4182 TaxID=1051891 RepID=A0A0C3LFZ2_9AGAM|nr:hypothetical protein M407DRAFT_96463 [Tulasnella calospora MUT 4182]
MTSSDYRFDAALAPRARFGLRPGKGDLRGLASGPASLELPDAFRGLAGDGGGLRDDARFRLVFEVPGTEVAEIGSGAAFRLLFVADVEASFVDALFLVFLAAGVAPSEDDRSASAALALARVTRISELFEAEAEGLDVVASAEELFVAALDFFALGSDASGGGEVDLLLVLSDSGG